MLVSRQLSPHASAKRAAGCPPATAAKRYGAGGPESWTAFWQGFCPEKGPHERCSVPGDGRDTVDRHLARFASDLPPGAHVIDLGCGAGIVGRELLSRRSDLRVTGVDWADLPALRQANLAIHTRVRMESLPFGDNSFDAAVSLFGIEYGNIAETAGELGRVLRPGARFSFLLHHRESEIVRASGEQRMALKELISGQMRGAFLSGSAAGVDEQRRSLGRRFPNESMVGLVGNHFRRNIDRTRAERQAIWQKLADDLGPEISLLLQLERSAKSAAEIAVWLVPLLSTTTPFGRTDRMERLRRQIGGRPPWLFGGGLLPLAPATLTRHIVPSRNGLTFRPL
jgi:SAM-dependent methyltransferase